MPRTLSVHRPDPSPDAPKPDRLEELSQIIHAYNQVTEKLRQSHEALRQQVQRLERQLASADAQLQRSRRLAALGQMAAGIAHEVRNPLAAIQLYAGLIVEDLDRLSSSPSTPVDPAALRSPLEHARQILQAVQALDAVVHDVLSFAREMHPRRRQLLVHELFQRALWTNAPAIQAADVQVSIRVQPPELSIYADADLMHQALVNLIRNAIEAMTSRPQQDSSSARSLPTRQLFLQARQRKDWTVLTIRDTGPGLSDADIERIFNPFFTTRPAGTGLGLAIVHRIVDAHHGLITAANHPRGGAVFQIRLPVTGSASTQTSSPAEASIPGPSAASEPLILQTSSFQGGCG